MYKIQTLNKIASVGLNQFPSESYIISDHLTDPDAVIVRSQEMHHLSIPASVQVIGRAGAGVNNIPVAQLTKTGIPVLNTPGANANAVRELVLAGMLLACRNLVQAADYVRTLHGSSEELAIQVEKNKKQFIGFELFGKTLGVIGLGNVGVKVANAALSLGMHVVGYDPTITVNRAWELSSEVKQARSIDELLVAADFISFHVPLTSDTKNMISAHHLQMMKHGVVLLNFAREGIVDNQALAAALNEQKIYAYVTDFPAVELKHHARVLSLPHLGASTKEAEENCAVMVVKQVRYFLETGAITNAVNFPTVDMPYSSGTKTRLAIVNNNIPNMVAQISSQLASAGLNILSFTNKSKDDIAYSLVDVNADIDERLLHAIAQINGVVRVRKIVPSQVPLDQA